MRPSRARSAIAGAAVAVAVTLSFGGDRAAAAADLDRGYSNDGRATAFFPGWKLGNVNADLAVGANGRAVVGTELVRDHGPTKPEPALAVFDPDGRSDRRFSGDGRVVLRTAGIDSDVRVAAQPDGRFLVASNAGAGSQVIRLRRSGRIDRSFGDDGRVPLELEALNALEVEPDGSILAVGSVIQPGAPAYSDFGAIRLVESGARDRGFGVDGLATVDFHLEGEVNPSDDAANAVALRPGGGMILCGNSLTSSADTVRNVVVLTALRADGTLDTGFGEGGRVFADPDAGITSYRGESAGGMAVAIGPRGAIAFGGTIRGDLTASVYTPFGRPDPLFAGDGTAVIDASGDRDDANALAVDANGRIYLAGSVRGPRESFDFAVLRLTTGGQRDLSYGVNGLQVVDFDDSFDDADAIELRANGKALVSGTVGHFGIAVVRLAAG